MLVITTFNSLCTVTIFLCKFFLISSLNNRFLSLLHYGVNIRGKIFILKECLPKVYTAVSLRIFLVCKPIESH